MRDLMFSVIPMKLIVNCETGPKEVSIISACRIKMPLTTCYFSHSLLPHKNEITTAVWKLAQFSSGVFWMLIYHEKDSDQQVLQLTKKLMATAFSYLKWHQKLLFIVHNHDWSWTTSYCMTSWHGSIFFFPSVILEGRQIWTFHSTTMYETWPKQN